MNANFLLLVFSPKAPPPPQPLPPLPAMPPVGPADLPILGPPPPPPGPPQYGPPDLTPANPPGAAAGPAAGPAAGAAAPTKKEGESESSAAEASSSENNQVSESTKQPNNDLPQPIFKFHIQKHLKQNKALKDVNRKLDKVKQRKKHLRKIARKVQTVTNKLQHHLLHHKHTKHHHKHSSNDASPTVYELVTRLEAKFKKELAQLESEETSQVMSFDKLVATLNSSIERLNNEQDDAKALQAETSGEAGKAEQQLESLGKDKKAQIKTDSDTKESCDMDRRDSEEAVRILNEQLAGIAKALEILRPPKDVKSSAASSSDSAGGASSAGTAAAPAAFVDVSAVEQASLFLLTNPEGEVAEAKKAREAEELRSKENADEAANAFISKRESQEKLKSLADDLQKSAGLDISKNGNSGDAELVDLAQSASLLDQTVETGNNEEEKEVDGLAADGEGEVKELKYRTYNYKFKDCGL
jgi:hypothetical protein